MSAPSLETLPRLVLAKLSQETRTALAFGLQGFGADVVDRCDTPESLVLVVVSAHQAEEHIDLGRFAPLIVLLEEGQSHSEGWQDGLYRLGVASCLQVPRSAQAWQAVLHYWLVLNKIPQRRS